MPNSANTGFLYNYYDDAASGGVLYFHYSTLTNNAVGIRIWNSIHRTVITKSVFESTGKLLDPYYDGTRKIYYSIESAALYNHNPHLAFANVSARPAYGIYGDLWEGYDHSIAYHPQYSDPSEPDPVEMNNACSKNTFNNIEDCIAAYRSGVIFNSNSFDNAATGINIFNTNPSFEYANTLRGDTFKIITNRALSIFRGQNDVVEMGNQFNPDEYNLYNLTGIHLVNAKDFTIRDNKFNVLGNGISVSNSQNIGSEISYGSAPNSFLRCQTAVQASNHNETLEIRCNDFDNTGVSGNTFRLISNTGVLHDLGTAQRPAGNTLLIDNPQADNQKLIFSSNFLMYYADAGNIPVNSPLSQFSVVNTGLQNVCGSSTAKSAAVSGQDIDLFNNYSAVLDSLNMQLSAVTAAIDHGNTVRLLSAINGSVPTGRLKNLLMDNSPLGDEVLIELIRVNPLSVGNFKIVILANSPVSDTVYQYLGLLLPSLPPDVAAQISGAQGFNPGVVTAESVNRDIEYISLKRGVLLKNIINSYRDNDSIQPALALLEMENTPVTNRLLTDYYLSAGDAANALARLNRLPVVTGEDQAYYDLHTVLINLAADSLSLWQMDSVQQQTIRRIASSDMVASDSKYNAKVILNLVFGEPIVEDSEVNAAKAGTITQPGILKLPPADEKMKYGYSLGIAPNPSAGKTYISYILPDNSAETELLIHSAAGTELKDHILMYDEGTIVINPGELPPGVYLVSIKENGTLVGSKKMIILSD